MEPAIRTVVDGEASESDEEEEVNEDLSHNMRNLTNDLFHLEDRVDFITSCMILPDININGRFCLSLI
uniref:Uncharacterized protein n=1 Tax=Magallana gigas TaxID=29159 RepID=K1Q387_MAGGI